VLAAVPFHWPSLNTRWGGAASKARPADRAFFADFAHHAPLAPPTPTTSSARGKRAHKALQQAAQQEQQQQQQQQQGQGMGRDAAVVQQQVLAATRAILGEGADVGLDTPLMSGEGSWALWAVATVGKN